MPPDFRQTELRYRIDGIQRSFSRARYAFLTSIVVSLCVIVPLWTAYFSWERSLAIAEEPASTAQAAQAPVKDRPESEQQKRAEYLRTETLSEWVKNQTIAVPVLGLRIDPGDAAALVPTTLLIITLWFFYSMRKQNHLIGVLLAETLHEDTALKRMVYYGISTNLLFLDLSGNDDPIANLKDVNQEPRPIPLIRLAMRCLMFLPTITIAFIILVDILTITILPSAVRYPNGPLLMKISIPDWIWIAIFEGSALVIGAVTTFLSWRILKFESANGKLFHQYWRP